MGRAGWLGFLRDGHRSEVNGGRCGFGVVRRGFIVGLAICGLGSRGWRGGRLVEVEVEVVLRGMWSWMIRRGEGYVDLGARFVEFEGWRV